MIWYDHLLGLWLSGSLRILHSHWWHDSWRQLHHWRVHGCSHILSTFVLLNPTWLEEMFNKHSKLLVEVFLEFHDLRKLGYILLEHFFRDVSLSLLYEFLSMSSILKHNIGTPSWVSELWEINLINTYCFNWSKLF